MKFKKFENQLGQCTHTRNVLQRKSQNEYAYANIYIILLLSLNSVNDKPIDSLLMTNLLFCSSNG